MLELLAQAERDHALAKGYLLLFWIALAGLVGVLSLVGLFLLRRVTRRRLDAIERDIARRRQAGSVGRIDAWSAGADRYIDHDKLPDSPPHDTEANPEPLPGEDDEQTSQASDRTAEEIGEASEVDEEDDEDVEPMEVEDFYTPPGFDEPNPDDEPDPFGLFEDKPFRESEDEEDFEQDDDAQEEGEEGDEEEGGDEIDEERR